MSKSLSQRVFDQLVDSSDDRCAGISERACKVAPGNFLRIVGANFFTKLGDAIVSPKVTLAWLMGTAGAPAFLVGLLVPIRESGSLLPQLIIAGYISRLAIRKKVWIAGALVQAPAIAGIGLVALFLDGQVAGWSIIALLVLFSLARAFSSITYVVDIAEGNERTDYVAVSNTAIGFVLLFTGVLGAMAAVFSVPLVVIILSLLGLAGVVMGSRLPEA